MTTLYGKHLKYFGGRDVTFDELLAEAPGLNIVAAKCDLQAMLPEPWTPVNMEHHVTLYDTVTGVILADNGVSREYGIVQYGEALGLIEELINANYAKVFYAGAPGRGATAYVVLRANGTLPIGGDGQIENQFVVSTSHDGSSKLNVLMTPTLGNVMFLPFYNTKLSFKHSKHVMSRMDQARQVIKNITQDWDKFSDEVQRFLQVQVTEKEAENYFRNVMGQTELDKEMSTKMKNIIEEMTKYFTGANAGVVASIPGLKGTLAAAYFAVNEWVENDKTKRKSKRRPDAGEAELYAQLSSEAARQKVSAYSFALNMRNLKIGL